MAKAVGRGDDDEHASLEFWCKYSTYTSAKTYINQLPMVLAICKKYLKYVTLYGREKRMRKRITT